MLTEGADTKVGGSGNDTFNALEASVVVAGLTATLTALDNLDGGAGTDTLNVAATKATLDTTGLGLTVKNIEVANFQGTQILTVDSSAWTGLTNLNVTKSVLAATLTAANTTDINVAGAEAAVTTNGGKSITIAQAMDKAADVITVKGGGAVTVTATDSNAAANGAGAGIDIGNTTAVTGAVVVTSTGAKIVGGTGAVAMDDIKVNGGTTVSVTQAATADMGDVATKGIATDVITQGAVTVTGGNATTSVSIVQGDQVTAVLAKAAVTGVSATKVVTFVDMLANETVTFTDAANTLVFTASKALTAAQVAAAFASLTATETQGQGFSSNGFYTNTGTGLVNWNTGAVSGNTVTFSEKVANSGATLTVADTTVTGTVAAVAGATGVTAVTAVTGVLGVANGAVIIDDNATKSITTVTVDGYSAGAVLGGTTTAKSLDALTTLTLANSGAGTVALNTTATSLALTVNDVAAAVNLDITAATVKTLGITTATKDSAFALTAAAVTDLTIAGTNAVNLTGSSLTALETVTVSGTAGLTLVPNGTAVKSVTTTATTGTVTATIQSDVATYTGGAGVDNVIFSNTTAATKAVTLGAGDDSVTVKTGTTLTVPTLAIDGGLGIDTLGMASADAQAATAAYAAKFTSFEKLSLGQVVTATTATVDLSNLNNISYVITAGGAPAALPTGVATNGAGGSAELTTYTFGAGLAAGESFTINGLTVTSTAANTANDVAAVFRSGVTAGTLTVTGAYATPSGWTGAPVKGGATNVLTLTNTVNGDVTDFTTASGVGSGALTLTKMANAGTLELTGAGTGAKTVTMLDATSLTADSFNIVTKLSTADLNYGTVAVAGVETITLNITDTAPTVTTAGATFGTASIQTATLNLSDAAVKSITVTGNANLTLTNTDNVALTMLDASALTGKLNATTNGTVAQTIKGGTAADTLTSLSTSSTADVLQGGLGNDIFNTNMGLTTLTGGAGADIFNISVASLNVNSYSTITDASAGDIIDFAGAVGTFAASKVVLGGTAVFQDYANAATVGGASNAMSWFQFGGDTYIIKDVNANTSGFINGSDMIVKLTGAVDLSIASYNGTNGTIEIA